MTPKMKTRKRAVVAMPMPRFDVTKAREYGPVTYLFENPRDVSAMSGQAAMDKIAQRLREISFDQQEDAIVMTGQVAIVAMLLLAAWDGVSPVRCLLFDARDGGSYRMHLIDPRSEPIS
jgi:2-methylaconitate cis-trans-isomerase PrpF